MNHQNNQRLQTILPAAIVAIFLFGAFNAAFARTGVGKKYNARDPRPCQKAASPGKVPTAAEAVASVICNGEHELGNQSLFLLADVKVTQIGKGSPYKPGVDFNVGDLDPLFLIHPIRGSFKKYQCGKPDPTSDGGKSCRLYDEANAQGRCYKNTFGAWQCSMDDKTVGFNDYTEVAPPGGAATKQTAAAPAAKKTATNNQTDKPLQTAEKKTEAENKGDGEYPKPDFSEMEKWYEITKYEYTDPAGENLLYIYIKPKAEAGNRPKQFKMEYRDKDGVEPLGSGHPLFGTAMIYNEVGSVGKLWATVPKEKDMEKVVSVKVVRIKD